MSYYSVPQISLFSCYIYTSHNFRLYPRPIGCIRRFLPYVFSHIFFLFAFLFLSHLKQCPLPMEYEFGGAQFNIQLSKCCHICSWHLHWKLSNFFLAKSCSMKNKQIFVQISFRNQGKLVISITKPHFLREMLGEIRMFIIPENLANNNSDICVWWRYNAQIWQILEVEY